ncbi:MAG: hypothetical protein A2Y07_08595 [Planctomycetes bacterium GWF2_50_10]|nr:MAG: hypothetical protein A2Y07_08595 [Planctomycetes bacterium GWF2_50_10]
MLSKRIYVAVLLLCFSGAVRASFIDASQITLTAAGEWAGSEAVHMIDGSGLQPDLTLKADATDMQNYLCAVDDGRWLPQWRQGTYVHNTSPSGINGDGWIQFTFSTPQDISKMWIWNYNNPGYLSRGLKTVAVDYSTNGTTWNRLGGGDAYQILAQAPGTDGYVCNNKLDLSAITGIKSIILTVKWNFGTFESVSHEGLSEVRFETVPEPVTMILLGLGGLSMIRRKRG